LLHLYIFTLHAPLWRFSYIAIDYLAYYPNYCTAATP
jgi:hypothetical protein